MAGEVKPLTKAQFQYFMRLNAEAIRAQEAISGFVDQFLRVELEAPAEDGWVLERADVGFVRVQQKGG